MHVHLESVKRFIVDIGSTSGDFLASDSINSLISSLPFENVDYFIANTLDPLAPSLFTGAETGFEVAQYAFVEDSEDFVIIEYNVTNTSESTSSIYIASLNDWGVVENDENDVELERNFVYQKSNVTDGVFKTIGVASLLADMDQYLLDNCCGTAFEVSGSNFADSKTLIKHFLFATKDTEECDDGNQINNDGCSADCLIESEDSFCGDGCSSSCEAETEWFADSDEDGFGNPDDSILAASQPDGYVADDSDCDDADATLNTTCETFALQSRV